MPDTAETLSYKPDWEQAQARIQAYWEQVPVDRPCIDVKAPRTSAIEPPPAPRSLEDRWLNPDYIAAKWEHMFETTYFGGEAVPAGPILLAGYATGCGPGVQFAETTIWHPVTMSSIDEPLGWWPGPDDPWRHKLTRLMDRMLELAARRFLVGIPGQVPAHDLLMLLRGPGEFLVELAERPARCVERMLEMLDLHLENSEYLRGAIEARQPGCVYGWPGIWHPTFVKTTQSDMSCMISGAMFDQYVLPELDRLGERYGEVWYHLDGPGAVRHLPRLLSRPYIKAIQYVPGDGAEPNGPAWLDLYREVQAAGRCLDLDVPAEHVEFLVRRLRPEGVMLRTREDSPERADELLHLAGGWCGTHATAFA
jgi:hypothetical protein